MSAENGRQIKKKTCNICGKQGPSSRYCKSDKKNQNRDYGGARQNGTRSGSKADDNESSYDNVECILSNFDDEFSFVEFEDACSYDGESKNSSEDFNNDYFFFKTNVQKAFIRLELSNVVPQMNQINSIELINNPY